MFLKGSCGITRAISACKELPQQFGTFLKAGKTKSCHVRSTHRCGGGSKPWYLVNIKIAGKWMFIPPKMVSIGIDP